MTITERLRTEFPGITAMIGGFVNALRAYRAYNRALEDMEAFKMKIKMVEKGKLIKVYKYLAVQKKYYGDTQRHLEDTLVSIETELHLSHSESMALRREAEEAIYNE